MTEGSQHEPVFFAVVNDEAQKTENSIVINLDEDEIRLFQTIQKTINYYESGRIGRSLVPHGDERLQVRVAGGWVRDKILKICSHDIDLAINIFTGVQFAELLKEETDCDVSNFGVIAANPAQSKHLETACLKIHGIDLDISNLRSNEVYQSHSRIPEVEVGTPNDDAHRRDFTMNSLFYNLNTQTIEDWTGRGYADLMNRRIVTPLDANTTYHDDPLRVLRAIRFGVRYNFTIESKDIIMDPEIRLSLSTKVSRERIGIELESMISGKNARPVVALEMIHTLQLAPSVFHLPTEVQKDVWEQGHAYLQQLPAMLEHCESMSSSSTTTKLNVRLVHVLCYLLPIRNITYTVKYKQYPILHYVFRESLKCKNTAVQAVVTIAKNIDHFVELLNTPFDRVRVGLLLRDVKESWVTTLFLAAIVGNTMDERLTTLYTTIRDELDECWKIRPLLDGKALIQTLDLQIGPAVGMYMDEQIKWMLEHPYGTAEECIEHLHHFPKRQKCNS